MTKMNKASILIMASIFLLNFTGCATVFGGGNYKSVHFNSEPTGAKVLADGALLGVTPCDNNLKDTKSHHLTFKKDGYLDSSYYLGNSVGAGWVIADLLLGGLIGLIIDAATGSWYGLDETEIQVELQKEK